MTRNNQRSNRERVKYGICLNEEEGCQKCKNKEILRIPMRKDFVCPECGRELRECPPPKPPVDPTKILIIIASALVVVGGIVTAVLSLGGKSEFTLSLEKTQQNVEVNMSDTIKVLVTPDDMKVSLQYVSDNENVLIVSSKGVVKALSEGVANVTVTAQPPKGAPISAVCNYIVIGDSLQRAEDSIRVADSITIAQMLEDSINKAKEDSIIAAKKGRPGSRKGEVASSGKQKNSKLHLSYGNYVGSIKGGYPHGQGRLTYSTSRVINRNDPKQRRAQAGDYVIGEFFNGFLVHGSHYNAAGELIEYLTVGVGNENSYDVK